MKKELSNLFITIASICFSVWLLAQVIINPISVGSICGWLCILTFVLGIGFSFIAD